MKNKKKILLVSNMYPSKKYPHYGVFVRNCEFMLKKKYKVDKVILGKNDNKFKKAISYLFFYIKTIIRGIFGNYDVIYGHYASHIAVPLLIIKFIKRKQLIVLNVHGNDIVPENNKDCNYLSLSKKIVNISNYIISPSKYFKRILVDEYNVGENKITIFPSGGIDLNNFYEQNKEASKKALELDTKKRYIGFVSRIEPNKGWDDMLNAIKLLDSKLDEKYLFLFVGSGSEDVKFNSMVSQLNISHRIIKKSFMSQGDLRNLYNSLDLFCFPTKRKSESLGLVGLEAMACGVPVIASNHYGPTSYIKDKENGYFFKTGDYYDLAQVIESALNNDNLIIKKNAKKEVLLYSKEECEKVLIELFDSIIN